jgi:hypothetical protein
MKDKQTPKETAIPQPGTRPQAMPATTFTQPPQTPQKTAGSSLLVGPRKPSQHATLQLKAPAPPAKTAAPATKVDVARQENEGGPPAKDADGNVA